MSTCQQEVGKENFKKNYGFFKFISAVRYLIILTEKEVASQFERNYNDLSRRDLSISI